MDPKKKLFTHGIENIDYFLNVQWDGDNDQLFRDFIDKLQQHEIPVKIEWSKIRMCGNIEGEYVIDNDFLVLKIFKINGVSLNTKYNIVKLTQDQNLTFWVKSMSNYGVVKTIDELIRLFRDGGGMSTQMFVDKNDLPTINLAGKLLCWDSIKKKEQVSSDFSSYIKNNNNEFWFVICRKDDDFKLFDQFTKPWLSCIFMPTNFDSTNLEDTMRHIRDSEITSFNHRELAKLIGKEGALEIEEDIKNMISVFCDKIKNTLNVNQDFYLCITAEKHGLFLFDSRSDNIYHHHILSEHSFNIIIKLFKKKLKESLINCQLEAFFDRNEEQTTGCGDTVMMALIMVLLDFTQQGSPQEAVKMAVILSGLMYHSKYSRLDQIREGIGDVAYQLLINIVYQYSKKLNL